MDLFARVTSLSGRVVQTFEDTLRADFPTALLQQSLEHVANLSEGRAAEPGALPAGHRHQGREQRERGSGEHAPGGSAVPG